MRPATENILSWNSNLHIAETHRKKVERRVLSCQKEEGQNLVCRRIFRQKGLGSQGWVLMKKGRPKEQEIGRDKPLDSMGMSMSHSAMVAYVVIRQETV